MTDQQNYESNHEKESLLEENVQPPIVEQDQQKHVPTSVILSLAFYLALSYLSILLCFTVALGALGIILLAFLWLHLLCFIIATVLLWNGKNKGNKTTLYIASALYFVSMIAAYDPEWEWSPFFFLETKRLYGKLWYNEVLYGPDKVVEIFYQCFVTL